MQKRNDIFPLAETTPLLRLAMWLVLGITTGVYSPVAMHVFLVVMSMTLVACLILYRKPLLQSVLIALTVFLLGATLAAHQRDELSDRGMTIRQWQQAQKEPDASTHIGRSRLFFLQQRERLSQRYRQQGLEGDAYAMVAAMTLGDRAAIDQRLRETYNVSGASHVLALSGLHMGIIYALLSLLTIGRRWRFLSQVIIVLSIWAFVFLVGLPTSAVRAASMLTLYALLSLGYRDRLSLNALAFTAIVMLLVDPYLLFDVGFQMSYLAVLSILVWTPVMNGWLGDEVLQRHRWLRWLWGLLTVSVAAQLGVAPLIAYYFGRFSTCFLLTNLVAIPGVTLILYLSLATLLWAPMAAPLTAVVGIMNRCLETITRLPGASIEHLHPSGLQVSMVYLLVLVVYWLCVFFRRR